MTQYAIYVGNMERLRKKIERIRNKCKKYGCDFHYEEVGEEFREVTLENGEKITSKFILVEAEGVAVVNGWKFIASVEHTEKGNIINRACDIEVPERYYNSDSICEHCNSKRYRKDTFIVMNEAGEFKQVGKSCLKDFTRGMSAEGVAQYTALFDELIQGEEPYGGSWGDKYYSVNEFLLYVAETIKHFGYVRTEDSGRSTRDRAHDYYKVEHGGRFFPKEKERIQEEMESVSFNAESEDNAKLVKEALAWLASQEASNNYMHNLSTACNLEYTTWKNLGILASLFPTYDRELEHQAEQEKQKDAEQVSEYVGEVGDRIEIEVGSMVCVTSWETMYGVTLIYKIVDVNGNVYTWKTSKYVNDDVSMVKGTVKAHSEYRGVKQTELTRCKIA